MAVKQRREKMQENDMLWEEEILVELYVPASGQEWDVWIPAGRTVEELEKELGILAERLDPGNVSCEGSLLVNRDTGMPYPTGNLAYEVFRNGSRLMII